MTENQSHFCMIPMAPASVGRPKAALLNAHKWVAGQTILVRFLEGDPKLRKRVEAVAKEWTAPGMANLTLQFVEQGDSDIRIAFKQGNGSWSYLGTVALSIPQSQPTMNFGWLTSDSPDAELKRVVRHEFGHALGLIHEHQNPNQPIKWNRDAVIADLKGPPNNWDLATIENNMFKHYDPAALRATDVDPASIMMYPIPNAWTLDDFSVGLNTELSDKDKQLIREAYPL